MGTNSKPITLASFISLSVCASCVLLAACGRPPPPAQFRPTAVAAPPPPASAPASAALHGSPYPPTRTEALVETRFGTRVPDPYRWLEDEQDPEVKAWMTTQDRAARAYLGKIPGRSALERRFRDLYYVEAVGIPLRRGRRIFFAYKPKKTEKYLVKWRPSETANERLLLDPNSWSADGTVSLGVWSPSWNGRKVAFARKPNAADEATLYVLDVDSGKESKVDVIPGAKYAYPSWTPDSSGFYYTWIPTDPAISAAERPGYQEVRFHRLGTDPAKDRTVFPRTGDPSTFVNGGVSRDGHWLLATVRKGWVENDVYLRAAGQKRFKKIIEGKDASYTVTVWKDQLYIATNEGASNRRIFKVAAGNPARARWKEIVPADPAAALQSFSIVGGHLSLSYLKDVVSELRLTTLDGQPVRTVPLPALGSALGLVGLPDQDDAYFRFSSFTIPWQIYKTSVKRGTVALWARVDVPIDPSPYAIEQVFYPSKDGTKIPMFIVRRKDLVMDGRNPTLLTGYGGFKISLEPNFNASIYPWIEAGGVYAVANLRGGSEYGKAWYDAGRGAKKQNVFDDFIAAAEWLVAKRFTRPDRLAIHGGSNGGLLVGAAMVQRPDLFHAVVCDVPLLDMLRYHRFGSGHTWAREYGTADKEDEFRTLYAYSPYHHVTRAPYPALLMLSADHDDRVAPLHARKFIAAVQTRTAGSAAALLRIERHAGHGGADQVRHWVQKSADLYAFLMEQLDLTPAGSGAATGSRAPSSRPARAGAGSGAPAAVPADPPPTAPRRRAR